MKPWEHDLMAQSNTHRESQKGHMRCKAGRRDLRYSFCFNGGTGGYWRFWLFGAIFFHMYQIFNFQTELMLLSRKQCSLFI